MEVLEINHNGKIYKIKRKTLVYILERLSGEDFSNESDTTVLKAMKKYRLFDEMTLDSIVEQVKNRFYLKPVFFSLC